MAPIISRVSRISTHSRRDIASRRNQRLKGQALRLSAIAYAALCCAVGFVWTAFVLLFRRRFTGKHAHATLQIAGFKMLAKPVWVEIFPGGIFNQLRGGKAAAVLPDILMQPVKQRA